MTNKLTGIMLACVLAVGAVGGYGLLRARVAAEIYRGRLTELNDSYAQLQREYNKAVSKTAVTELRVVGGKVSVVIRDAAGRVNTVDTPYTADSEIFVDYVVVDGRLMIRRVFDENTPPREGVSIDPELLHIDWDRAGAMHGKATYRRLSDGRWVVTVTGDGSLGLGRATEALELAHAPAVRDYEPMREQADQAVRDIGPLDVLRAILP